MKKIIILLLGIFFFAGCSKTSDEPASSGTSSDTSTGLANPASVNCEEKGGMLEMREDDTGTYGVCIFSDGSECEEWAYFRGECNPGENDASDTSSISSFDDCVNAGNPVMESYPRQCRAGGETYTEELDDAAIAALSAPKTNSDVKCDDEYMPVCAMIQVQCIKAPCEPVLETLTNSCHAKQRGSFVLESTDGKCEKELTDTCASNSDCTLPGEYAAMSRCPFETVCLSGKCVVICPQSHATQ